MSRANTKNDNSDFVDEIRREASYRRCLIVQGNVRDVYNDGQNHYLPLSQVLLARFAAMQHNGQPWFSICGLWDSVDGLTFLKPMMQRAFQQVLKQSPAPAVSSRPSGSCPGNTYDDGSSKVPTPANKGSSANGIFKQPEEALTAMRRVLSSTTEQAVFILDWQEYLIGNPSHQDANERQLLTILCKAITEQPTCRITSDALKGPAGLLVIITSNLGSFPESFYKDNPRTKLINIPRPDRPQRLEFFTRNQRDLHVAEPKSEPGRLPSRYGSFDDATLNHMADLCDGLTMIDLQNILVLSSQLSEKMRPDRLVNLYKFGKQSSPWRDLDDRKLDNVVEELKKRVMGQDHAIEAVAAMLESAYVGIDDEKQKQPKGKLFFVGPTGVGKTELAKALAWFVFGDENALIHLDMTNYGQEHDVQRLVGAPPSYVGFEQGGELTNAIHQKPFSVIVFDEIEKAHRKIFDIFLQILDEGRLTDGRGQTVYFDQTIVIFTSNLGQDRKLEDLAALDTAALEAHFKKSVMRYLEKPISEGGINRPELIDRFEEDSIIPFHFITDPDTRKEILRSNLVGLKGSFYERYGMRLEVSDRCIDWIESRKRTGIIRRDIINIAKRYFSKNQLSRFIYRRRHQLKPGRIVMADVPAGRDKITFEIRDGTPSETE